MKKKRLYFVLVAEAILCIALAVFPAVSHIDIVTAAAFPFEQLGTALRFFSLSGKGGNTVAIILYIIFCISPCALLLLRKPLKLYIEDALAFLLSILLFFVVYLMINPSQIALSNGFSLGMPMAKAIYGGMVYSVIIGYIVLRILRLFRSDDRITLQRYLGNLLFFLNMIFVMTVFLVETQQLIDAFAAVGESNSGNAGAFALNYIFIFMQFIVDNLPSVLNIFIVFRGIALLEAMSDNRYSPDTVSNAKRLSRLCVASLSATVACHIIFNLLTLIFASKLFSITSTVQIPLFSIAFVLICLLLTRLITDAKSLQDENDSII